MKPRFSSLVRSRRFRACGAALALFPAQAAHAGDAGQAAPEAKAKAGPEIRTPRATSSSTGAGCNRSARRPAGRKALSAMPISRTARLPVGELAENVPGLIATQHSGEGKANQYFLRGFNLDHGTDLAGSSTEPRSTCGPMAMGRAISISTS
jgi:outer membrane receptor for Fe3+-dicitrate